MTMHRMRPSSRIVVAIVAIALGALLFTPIWRIDLMAPQYPEGLALQIFHDRFTGDIVRINGLNHYIGMATIENEMFPEFEIMRYAFYLLIAWGLVAAIVGRNGVLLSWLFGLFAFVIWAMWDMYAWGYKYGHDLDPHAAIKVEGMAYQPPLLGHKKLLNFDAWSLPDVGGWILFVVIALAVIVWVVEWRWPRKRALPAADAQTRSTPATAALALLVLLGTGCDGEAPPSIPFGQAECASCRMNVVDRQFAAALVTLKGRSYYFDSPECMLQHVADGRVAEEQIAHWYVCDHAHPGVLVDAAQAYYLQSEGLSSPMGGNTAAFASAQERDTVAAVLGGVPMDLAAARKALVDR